MRKRHNLPRVGTSISLAAHSLIFGLLLLAGRQSMKVRPMQARGGTRTVLYWQGASSAAHVPAKHATPKKIERNHAAKLPEPEAVPTPAPAPQLAQIANLTSGAGADSEDMSPAFPVFSPTPHIADRSLLPSANRNVVVDVNVSAQGEVLDEKLVQGLGNGLDQIILETVKSWKFHPASADGNAVASVAELVFPLSPKWRG